MVGSLDDDAVPCALSLLILLFCSLSMRARTQGGWKRERANAFGVVVGERMFPDLLSLASLSLSDPSIHLSCSPHVSFSAFAKMAREPIPAAATAAAH